MSLIVQLGTTSVGYTPTLNNTTVSTVGFGANHAAMNSTSRLVNTNQIQVAKHRLPMTINRQPQQHTLPVRNIAALARPIHQSPISANSALSATTHIQSQAATPVVAGRVLASPVKDAGLDDDLLEGVVEKRPKYHKHLPLNYQYVLQDHNYGAPPPPTPPAVSPPPKSPISSVPTTNGISVAHSHREHPHNLTLRSPTHTQPNSYPSSSVVTSAVIFNNSRQVPPVTAVANDVESDVSSDNEREVEPEGEETETAPEGEGEGEDEDSVTRCICDFQHDDGYMICCDRCSVWQHVDCMGIDRANIPEEYLCEKCQPRRVEKQRAISLQIRKRKEFETSDSSSETSSSSDNPAAIKPAMRKRAVISRRRSEPARKPTINTAAKQRRESAKENSNQQPRQSRQQNNRKRHIEKRPPTRRKSSFSSNSVYNNNSSTVEKKNITQPSASAAVSSSISSLAATSLSSEKINHHNDRNLTSPNVTSSGDSVQQLRQWIDSYEEAVTNHYSPELRARIANIKVNGVHSDLRLPSNLLATPKCRISLLPSGIKILMTCTNVQTNQPLIELRGKYMLCNSGGPGLMSRPPRPTAPPPPGPHIFHYKLPRDNTEVCVDCRTYGNDARFVRRSCQPNAEIRHCIEKGTLHLYIVTTASLDKNTEVTIAHSSNCGVPCICGDKDCHIKKEKEAVSRESPPRTQEKKNGLIKVANNVAPSTNSQSTVEKRRRGRRRTTSENQPPPEPPKINNEKSSTKQNSLSSSTALTSSTHAEKPTPAPVAAPPPPPPPPPQPPSPPVSPPSPTLPPMTRSASSGSRPNKNATAAIVKETNSTRTASPSTNKKDTETTKVSNSSNNNNVNSKDNSNNENIKNNNNNNSNNNNNNNSKTSNNNNEEKERKTKQQEEENLNNKKNNNISEETEKKEASDKKKKMTREERKMEAIMKAFERMEKDQARKQEAARQAQQRKDSTDTDKEKQPAVVENKTTNNKEKEREEKESATNNKNNALKRRKRKGRNRSQPTPQPVSRARARRAVRRTRTNSRSVSSSRNINDLQDDSDSGNSTDNDADEGNSSPSPKKNSSSNISQAAGLLMSLSTPNSYNADKDHDEDSNHYTRRSSFQNDSKDEHTEEDDDEEGSPRRLNTSTSSSDTPTTPLSNTCLLVAAAVGPLAPGFKFPKTKKGLLNNWFKAPDPGSPPSLPVPGPDESPTRPGPGKKRWLRQAISEECESPNRPEMSVSPTDYVAPLKKRRLARESISSEQSFTPPATPVEPVNQLNFDDEEEEPYGPGAEKRVDFDENGGGSSAAESDVESPAGPRTPLGPEPKSEPDPIKEEKVYEDEIRVVDRKRIDAIKDDKSYVLNTPIKMEKEAKHVDFKDEFTDVEHHDVKKEKKNSTPARKKVLSISEYRQRKRQGGRESQDGDIDGDDADGPENNTGSSNMVTSSPRSHTSDSSSMSSSDEEDANNANLISKSILLDANATTKTGSRFSCAPTLVERQRENLTERLRREFGLFLSDDEENMAARRQSLNNEIQLQPVQLSTVVTTGSTSAVTEKKDSTAAIGGEKEKKRKHAPPPPPPPLPVPGPPPTSYPMYHGYPPSVRGPAVYPPHFSLPPLPPPALEPVNVGSAAPYYGPPNSYYGHPPH